MELWSVQPSSGLRSQLGIIFICSLITGINSCTESQRKFTPTSQSYKANNRALVGLSYERMPQVSLVICARDCHFDVNCKSLNYLADRTCELNHGTRKTNPGPFMEQPGSVYFDFDESTSALSVSTGHREISCTREGTNTVFPSDAHPGIQVNCEDDDGELWIVIQRRLDGSVDFYRNWTEYRNGFGNLSGEFWLGNDNIQRLTESGGKWRLRVRLTDWSNNDRWVEYDHFAVEGAEYTLSLGIMDKTSHGDITDSFYSAKGRSFSTWDHDNDLYHQSCAVDRHGAWWYSNCVLANLNGFYYQSDTVHNYAIIWYGWTGFNSIQKCSMTIRQI